MSLDVTPPSLSFLTTRSPSVASPDLISATSPLREPPPYRPPPPATSSPGLSPSLSALTSPIKLIPVVHPVVSPPSVSQFRITPNSHHVPTTIYFQEKSFRDNECQDEVERVSSPRVHKEQIDVSPPVPPRRKSQDKLRLENKENANSDQAENEAHVKASAFTLLAMAKCFDGMKFAPTMIQLRRIIPSKVKGSLIAAMVSSTELFIFVPVVTL